MTSLTNHSGNPIVWCENQFAAIKCAPLRARQKPEKKRRMKKKRRKTKAKALPTLVILGGNKASAFWMCQSQSSEVGNNSSLPQTHQQVETQERRAGRGRERGGNAAQKCELQIAALVSRYSRKQAKSQRQPLVRAGCLKGGQGTLGTARLPDICIGTYVRLRVAKGIIYM